MKERNLQDVSLTGERAQKSLRCGKKFGDIVTASQVFCGFNCHVTAEKEGNLEVLPEVRR